MDYRMSVRTGRTFEDAVAAVRTALADQGFGILTEIDLAATLKAKIGADIPPQLILGACRPPLAHAALQVEPSIGLLLPCTVVVRSLEDGGTLVEAMDPDVMSTLTANPGVEPVAREAKERLTAALAAVAD